MYKKKTLRRMQPVTRRYARAINDLDGVLRRLRNLTEEVGRLELDSRALYSRREHEKPKLPIFAITEDDVLEVARGKFGIDILTDDQLRTVKKGVEFGLECWWEVVAAALGEALRGESETSGGTATLGGSL